MSRPCYNYAEIPVDPVFRESRLHSDTEDRYYLTATVGSHILFIVYTMREEVIRLISARPATKRERERYFENQ